MQERGEFRAYLYGDHQPIGEPDTDVPGRGGGSDAGAGGCGRRVYQKDQSSFDFRHGACGQSLQGGCAESVDAGEEEPYTCDI